MFDTMSEIIVIETCCACGITFGITEGFKKLKKRNGEEFYCPNGHSQYYAEFESTQKKIKQLQDTIKNTQDSERWWHDEAERKARELSVTRGQLTKTRNRIARGVCPCCNRQFTDLHRHMESKHPDYKNSQAGKDEVK